MRIDQGSILVRRRRLGGVMNENKGLTWPQIRYWLFCGFLIIFGVAATIWGGPWETIKPFTKELGPAFFIAGVLASFVEPFFRKEFARDAFLASFRYVLAPEFKEEVQKITRFGFLAEKQVWTVQIEKMDADTVRVTTTFERTIRNKTKTQQRLNAHVEVEDYKFVAGPTRIIECGVKSDTDDKVTDEQWERDHYVEAKTDEITLYPEKTARVWGKVVQYRRTNGDVWETFRTPIVNPEIEVIIDENEFSHSYQFGTHGDVTKSQYRNHYTLTGVYFPGQFMFVRWWPKAPANNDPPAA